MKSIKKNKNKELETYKEKTNYKSTPEQVKLYNQMMCDKNKIS